MKLVAQLNFGLALAFVVTAQVVNVSRSLSACGVYDYNIYCYGGVQGSNLEFTSVDADIYSLDFKRNVTLTELTNSWKKVVSDTKGVDISPRYAPQYASISEGQIVISGGYNPYSVTERLKDQTLLYDLHNQTWSVYTSYIEAGIKNRQIYYASTSFVPGKGLAFYGGFEYGIDNIWTMATTQSIPALAFNASRAVGYSKVQYLDVTFNGAIWNAPGQTDIPRLFYAGQSSVYSSIDKRIYYFGGFSQDTSLEGYVAPDYRYWYSLSNALFFDTVTNTWGTVQLKGSAIPSDRRFHTTTILPKNPEVMLLYGGEKLSQVVSDVCYTLDLKTFEWKKISFASQNDNNIARSGHSALILDNDTLVMAFGVQSTGKTTSEPILLDISNPSSITYKDSYTYFSPSSAVAEEGNTQNSTDTDSTTDIPIKGGMKTGAIVGIVMGIIAIIAIIVVVWFARRRMTKRSFGAKKKANNNQEDDVVIDWDAIKEEYTEIPSPFVYKSSNFSEIRSQTSDGTTMGLGDITSVSHPYSASSQNMSVQGTSEPSTLSRLKPDMGQN